MESASTLAPVPQNRGIPKIIGILNIVFAAALLLMGLCWAGLTVVSPYMTKVMKEAQEKLEKDQEAKHQADLKQLEDEEKAAKTEEEKAELRAVRTSAKSQKAVVAIPMIDVTKMMADRRMVGWTWAEIWTGIILNVLLLASGIGLVQFKPWGRTLGLWTAGLKIARLVLVYAYFALAIVPGFAQMLGKAVSEMMAQQQQALGKPVPPMFATPDFFTRTYTITYTIMSVGMILVGSIYPLIVLWLLSRPSARAACAGSKVSTKPDESW